MTKKKTDHDDTAAPSTSSHRPSSVQAGQGRPKQAEEALRESENKYRLLVENANEAIAVAQDGMLKFVNRMAMEITGFSEQELTSRPFPEFVHPDDRAMVVEHYLRRLKGDVSQPKYAFRLIAADGTIKWLEISAVLIDWEDMPATLNFFSDITERKRAEDTLRDSEEKYRSLASTADSMYLVDRECRYIFMNEGHLSRFGLSWAEVAGRSYSEFHSEEDTRHFAKNIERVFETGKSFQVEHKSQRDNKYFLRTFSPVADSKGSTFAVTIVSKDITAHRQAEEALRKSESNLRALALELSLVEENERQRLALFLHDEIGQSLSLLRMKFGSLADASTSRAAKKDLRKARDLLEARSGVDGHRHAGSQRHRSDTPDHDRSPRSQSDPALHARG